MSLEDAIGNVISEYVQDNKDELLALIERSVSKVVKPSEKIFKKGDAAKYLKITSATFLKLQRAGHIPPTFIGNIERYRESYLLSCIKSYKDCKTNHKRGTHY